MDQENIIFHDTSPFNNGHSSGYFDLERGVRQGDPLSPYLFILTIELLAHHIRQDKNIKGIQIASKESKLSQYADATTAIVSDKNSAKRFLDILHKFEKASGLKLTKIKQRHCGLDPKEIIFLNL